MTHPNSFRPMKPGNTADISRAPAHIQQAFDKPVPRQEGEVSAIFMIRHKNVNYTQTNTRVRAEFEYVGTTSTPRAVSLRVLDHRGIEFLSQIEMDFSELPTLIARLTELQQTLEQKE